MTTTSTAQSSAQSPAQSSAQPYLDQHGRIADDLPGAGLPWLDRLRLEGIGRFSRSGFPTTRTEAWKYTNLRDLARTAFVPAATKPTIGLDLLPTVVPSGESPHRLVFVDGRLRADLCSVGDLPPGAILTGLAAALDRHPDLVATHLGQVSPDEGGPMRALNTAFLADGLVLALDPGVRLERPVEAVFVGIGAEQPTMHHPRVLIVAGRGSEATVVEHHVGLGTGAYFSNVVTEAVVEDGARLHHYKIQAEGAEAFHVSTLVARLGAEASYDNFVLTMGGRLSRNELRPFLGGSGTECRLSGAYMVSGTQHADTTTVIDHAVPRCTSREVYKGVIDGAARAVFQGKIIVRPDAQKTDGYQLNRALLLSDAAEIDSKPELEIYADDVKCSHGATAGELDDDQLFYLRARGIDAASARNLLVAAFLLEALDEIRVETVRDAFADRVRDWLAAGRPTV
ncbi:Fe-S cluster assembly protein SufD [Arenibaculum sp.]|jgi:Fe-S cluster assembly protein SufD|uniref:Fe-S cluster assembly protein SufD n=1 Tax=Arenibaculum sp. TaxID=2865862 RepID=UPI002E0F433A|nr:Fe-S cluster assembly protein SufD [Arenibaculum sp.]